MTRECKGDSSFSFIVIVITILILAVGFAARAQDPESLFLPAVVYNPGGYRPVSAVVADVNRDGKLDIVVTNCARGTNQVCGEPGNWGVLLGNGNGTFKAVVTHAAGGPGFPSVAVADVNRDGKPDVLIAWGSIVTFERGAVDVMLGNGDGTFQSAGTYDAGGIWPRSIAVADLNNDGLLDLLVANSGSVAVSVLLGNGDGTFQAAVPYDSGGNNPGFVAVADVNSDRRPDVVVANYYGPVTDTGSIGVLLGNGDGSFQTPVTYIPSARGPVSVAVSDVNHDDRPDVVVAGYYGPETYSIGSIDVLLGNGDGTFQPSVAYGSGGSPTSTAVADIDGDGNEDLVAGNGSSRNIGVLLGNGDGTFRAAVAYDSGGYYVDFVSVADLNGDGRTDVLALSDSSVGVLLNNSRTVQTPTNTMLASSLNPSVYGQDIAFTGHVTSGSGAGRNSHALGR